MARVGRTLLSAALEVDAFLASSIRSLKKQGQETGAPGLAPFETWASVVNSASPPRARCHPEQLCCHPERSEGSMHFIAPVGADAALVTYFANVKTPGDKVEPQQEFHLAVG